MKKRPITSADSGKGATFPIFAQLKKAKSIVITIDDGADEVIEILDDDDDDVSGNSGNPHAVNPLVSMMARPILTPLAGVHVLLPENAPWVKDCGARVFSVGDVAAVLSRSGMGTPSSRTLCVDYKVLGAAYKQATGADKLAPFYIHLGFHSASDRIGAGIFVVPQAVTISLHDNLLAALEGIGTPFSACPGVQFEQQLVTMPNNKEYAVHRNSLWVTAPDACNGIIPPNSYDRARLAFLNPVWDYIESRTGHAFNLLLVHRYGPEHFLGKHIDKTNTEVHDERNGHCIVSLTLGTARAFDVEMMKIGSPQVVTATSPVPLETMLKAGVGMNPPSSSSSSSSSASSSSAAAASITLHARSPPPDSNLRFILKSGDCIVMLGSMQDPSGGWGWKHGVPPLNSEQLAAQCAATDTTTRYRFNLTFRREIYGRFEGSRTVENSAAVAAAGAGASE